MLNTYTELINPVIIKLNAFEVYVGKPGVLVNSRDC